MRIGGMASGIDTEQIVRDLMRVERMRVNKYLRQEQTLKWRMEAFNNVNKNMANFILNTRKDFGLTDISVNGNIRQNSTSNFTWVKQATSSNNTILSATAEASAVNGVHKIKVNEIASAATTTSKQLVALNGEADKPEFVLNSSFQFKNAGSINIETSKGTATISFAENESMSDFITKLNNAQSDTNESLGIKAVFDRNIGQIMITTKDAGDDKFIKISGSSAAQMFQGKVLEAEGAKGTSAIIEFNGATIKRDTNNFSVFGIRLNLTAKDPLTEITVNVSTNVDGIFDKVKEFVNKYNELIDSINGKINEKHHKNFHPLTQEEKDAMSEKEIDLWEEKAKSGLLRNDENLSRVLQSIRNDLYKDVEGVTGSFKHIADIGITTGFYKDGGKLVIDENKLRNAIGNDPDGVMNLFFKAPDTTLTGKERMESSGLVQRVYDGLAAGMKEVIRHSGPGEDAALYRSIQSNMLIDFVSKHSNISVIDRDLSQLNNRIAREEQILAGRENSYWKRFTAMEKAMSQMNQQSAWLMSQLGLSQ